MCIIIVFAGRRTGENHAVRHRNRKKLTSAARNGDRGASGIRRGRDRTLRKIQGESSPALRDGRCEAHTRHRNEPHSPGRGKDHREHRSCGRNAPDRAQRVPCPARAFARAGVRHQGRRVRRRVCTDSPHGGHQPAFHGRFPRRDFRQQPALRAHRQPHQIRQLSAHKGSDMAAVSGPQRPRSARGGSGAGRQRERRAARGRLCHHGGERDHGGALPCDFPRRPQAQARQHRHRLRRRRERGTRARPQSGRVHDRTAPRRDSPQHRADSRRHAGIRPRRAFCKHRARVQQHHRHTRGNATRRLRRDGSRLRRGTRRRKIPRHQMQKSGTAPCVCGAGRYGAQSEIQRRSAESRSRGGKRRRPRKRL